MKSKFQAVDFGIALLVLMLFASEAIAQTSGGNTLKEAGISVFNVLYGIVGVVGAIALLVFAINMKFNFIQNPMKHFLTTAAAVFLAFSVVAIVQFLKTAAGSQSINSL